MRRKSPTAVVASTREVLTGVVALLACCGVLQATESVLGAEPAPAAPAAAATPAAETLAARPLDAALPSPPVVSYAIEARLDATAHRVDGKQTLVFRNASSAPLSELYFHLYLNAFKNERSVFLRSPFGAGRSGGRAKDWGYIDVKRCTLVGEGSRDLWPQRTNGSPSEPDDETDVRVPLPTPLPPGQSLTLELEFSAKLPAVVLRTGYSDDFHFVGQWFPKLAKLEPDATFAHFPFHAQAEFYADYGDYDVTLDVPESAVVGATGERVSASKHGERKKERYVGRGIHDFAWTAWPGFRERTREIDGVKVRLLYPEDQSANAELTLGALAFALPRASALYGRYPYPTLTVVHPPEPASEAGGMEYPTLITTGGAWVSAWTSARSVEAVTIHELMHQWFYGLLGSNEARSPFLDEGLTSYAELRTLEAGWGTGSAFRGFGLELSLTSLGRAFAATRAEDQPVSSAAADFPSFTSLAALVYSRTATILETLARVYGRDRFEAALGLYARRYRFGHPRPEDFTAVIGEALGEDARRVLELALDARGRVNFLVRDVQSAQERPAAGVFDRDGERETVPAPSARTGRYRGRAVILRHGSLELPVEIEIVDRDGGRQRKHWDGRGPLHVLEWQSDARPAFVVVDPEHKILLDDDLLDNAASAQNAPIPARTLERATYVSQLLLQLLGP